MRNLEVRPAVGVVVPVRDENEHLGACLDAVGAAARAPLRTGIPVRVVVVLDRCVDHSGLIAAGRARRWTRDASLFPELTLLSVDAGNVGVARARGCDHLITGFRSSGRSLWLATTDADSVVPRDWLVHQLAEHRRGAEVWVGTIEVDDRGTHAAGHVRDFSEHYRRWEGSGHPHVHGANLGFTGRAYRGSGGFMPLATGEDHDLVRRMRRSGARVSRGAEVAVLTSDRALGRAPDGFAAALAADGLWRSPS